MHIFIIVLVPVHQVELVGQHHERSEVEEEANVENTNGFVNESEEVDEAVVVRTLVRQADEFHLS